MNKILKTSISFILLLILTLSSCKDDDKESLNIMAQAERMLATDSLSGAALDTLATVNTEQLSDFDKSRHTVLTALARYKCYIPLGSDSLLTIAVKCFEDRKDSLEYLSCLLIGIANSEVQRYDRAFMNLHKAEDLALSDSNFYYAALAQREQGDIYRKYHMGKDGLETAVEAAGNFKKAGKMKHAEWAIIDQARSLIDLQQSQKAIELIDSILSDASTHTDDYYKSACYYTLSFAYEHVNKPHESLKYLELSGWMNPRNASHLLRLGRIYARCWKLKDAEECLALSDGKQLNHADSINYFFLKSEINRMKGDYQQAFTNLIQSYNKYTSDLEMANSVPFDDFADKYYKDMAQKNLLLAQRQKQINILWLLVGVVSLISFTVAALYVHKRNRLVKEQTALDILRLNDVIAEARSEIERLNEKAQENIDIRHMILISEYKSFDTLYRKWIEIEASRKTSTQKLEAVKEIFRFLSTDAEFKSLEAFVNSKSDGLIQCIRDNYPHLNEKHIHLAIMYYLHLSNNTIANILSTSVNAVYMAKTRLKKAIEENETVGPRISAELFS